MQTEIQRQARRLSYVALGSNLGDSRRIVLEAMTRLQNLSVEPVRKSSLWQTTPVNCPPGSLMFVNAVAGLRPRAEETPESLLEELLSLEEEFGHRPRKVPNEPRPLDLDLIAFGDVICNTQRLILPHPRAQVRRFVLQPLSEIAPDLVLPGQSRTVTQLLAGLMSSETVTRL